MKKKEGKQHGYGCEEFFNVIENEIQSKRRKVVVRPLRHCQKQQERYYQSRMVCRTAGFCLP